MENALVISSMTWFGENYLLIGTPLYFLWTIILSYDQDLGEVGVPMFVFFCIGLACIFVPLLGPLLTLFMILVSIAKFFESVAL